MTYSIRGKSYINGVIVGGEIRYIEAKDRDEAIRKFKIQIQYLNTVIDYRTVKLVKDGQPPEAL